MECSQRSRSLHSSNHTHIGDMKMKTSFNNLNKSLKNSDKILDTMRDARESNLREIQSATDLSADSRNRAEKREKHHISRYSKISQSDSKDRTVSMLREFLKSESGYDMDKIRTLSECVSGSRPFSKINSGLRNAIRALAKLDASAKDSVSVTSISAHVAHKNNVRTSFTLLCKLGLLEQQKDSQSVTGYTIRNRDALRDILELSK